MVMATWAGVARVEEPAAATDHAGDGLGRGGQDRGHGPFGDEQRGRRLGGQGEVPRAAEFGADPGHDRFGEV
jgi:hypothetical protein